MTNEEQLRIKTRKLYNKIAAINKEDMYEKLSDYSPNEVHVIEFIAYNKDVNVTNLSDNLFLTKGALSKITKRLISKDVICSYQKKDNKKEVFFKLCEKGKQVAQIHQEIHELHNKRDQQVFDSTSDKEFEVMIKFIDKYDKHLDKFLKE